MNNITSNFRMRGIFTFRILDIYLLDTKLNAISKWIEDHVLNLQDLQVYKSYKSYDRIDYNRLQ